MNRSIPSTSKQNVSSNDEEVFEDSSILANFNNSSFKQSMPRLSQSNTNDSPNKSALNVSALCCDEEISGYDKLTGQTWIYPTNYPVRDYQFNIIKAAILKNTLVSLPTGLGKTFIAAVIMYNFYRWYPLGKIVFTAPTRPLVAQQIEACYDIIAIPPADTVEMTGHMQVKTRKTHWQTKRVFFATPQVIYNDIKAGICPAEKIRCLVIDEAHRARGNYAYCQIVATLTDMGHKTYRLLALSATPGSKVEDVANVVKNLHIAHLELRTENCIDVSPYSHVRKISTVVVQLGPELTHLRQQYVEILDGYARRLKQLNILPHNLGNLSKGRIVMLYKEYQNKERGSRHPQHNYIMKDFTLLIALYHGLELLVKHGSRVFLNFFDEHPEKSWIQSDDKLTALLERQRDDLGINPLALDRSILPDGTIPEMPKNLFFGHPKFYKLKEIMLEHFHRAKENGLDTRAIVFCEYRESVNLVHCLLLQCRPLITPQMFVGQGASGKDGKAVVSQKQLMRVMRNFREGACNTLVATCVAEEGLDVGSVDLILCFDISTRSPIRLVQRCGRTGRERGGQVFILVTEGREHQTLLDCMRQRDGLNKKILQSQEVQRSLYQRNPRMVPHDFMPQCQKMFITVAEKNDSREKRGDSIEKTKKGQKDLRSMFLEGASSSGSDSLIKDSKSNNVISEEEFNAIFPEGYRSTGFMDVPKEYWAMGKETFTNLCKREQGQLKLSTWLEWQRSSQKTVNIGHSKDTEILVSLLQYSDAKRFEMPASTQNPIFATQDFATQNVISSPAKKIPPAKTKQPKKKSKVPLIKSPAKKDGDIRALFSTATKSTKSYTKLINDLGIQNDGSIPTRLINLLVDLSIDITDITRQCYFCQNICDCSLVQNMRKNKLSFLAFITKPKFPDIDLIDEIDADAILKYTKADDNQDLSNTVCKENENYPNIDIKRNSSNNFDLEFDFDSPIDLASPDRMETKQDLDGNTENNFDIGDIEDIFADSSPEEAKKVVVTKAEDNNSNDPKETLGFFGLDSIGDIFADSDGNIDDKSTKIHDNVKKNCRDQDNLDLKEKSGPENELSPSILSGRQRTSINTSPILCTQARKFKLSIKKNQPQSSTPSSNVRRRLIPEPSHKGMSLETKSKSVLQSSIVDPSNKSMFTITQLVDMINKNNDEKLSKSSDINQEDKQNIVNDEEISTSPILLTQADKTKEKISIDNSLKNKLIFSHMTKPDSLIILESDSESDDLNQEYDDDEKINNIDSKTVVTFSESCVNSKERTFNIEREASRDEHTRHSLEPMRGPVTNKRKLELEQDDVINASLYFNKKQKTDDDGTKKPLTLKEKVLAALTSNKMSDAKFSNNSTIQFVFSPVMSQKENKNPQFIEEDRPNDHSDYKKEYVRKNNLEILQMFRRESQIDSTKNKYNSFLNSSANTEVSKKRKLTFDNNDDDFTDKKTGCRSLRPLNKDHETSLITDHKVPKKITIGNSFLDLEAQLSDDGEHSGDESSDESAGSIVDFICDDNVAHHEDMQAHYMRSVRSPIKGVFKIPQLPTKCNNAEIFSQFVEQDSYEMDSFCVDSHIGLTQVDEVSELERAEMLLEERKAKKRSRPESTQVDVSPLIRRRNKNVKRQIHSDSDDSS